MIEVRGRTYPVEVRYRPLVADEEGRRARLDDGGCSTRSTSWRAIDTRRHADLHADRAATSTRRPRRSAAGRSTGRSAGRDDRDPAALRPAAEAEQQRVFQPGGKRRIVIATNVAESSLTVPRIRYVIDPGTARISRYSPRSKTQRLPIEPISQASADQRHGRCGRIGPGICIRLYSEEDYASPRPLHRRPKSSGATWPRSSCRPRPCGWATSSGFPFLDPPKPAAIRDGYQTLFELGAVDEQQRADRRWAASWPRCRSIRASGG